MREMSTFYLRLEVQVHLSGKVKSQQWFLADYFLWYLEPVECRSRVGQDGRLVEKRVCSIFTPWKFWNNNQLWNLKFSQLPHSLNRHCISEILNCYTVCVKSIMRWVMKNDIYLLIDNIIFDVGCHWNILYNSMLHNCHNFSKECIFSMTFTLYLSNLYVQEIF